VTVLCRLDEIPEPGSKGLSYQGHSLFAVRSNGGVYLYRNRCPHLGIELHWQEDQFLDVEETLIQCATHGALFIIESGECVSGPCLGQTLQALRCRVENGELLLDELLAEQAP